MRSARTHQDLAGLIQKVVQEQKALCTSQRRPGELAPMPLNRDGARAGKPGAERSGRPPDPRGVRVGRKGYLTPGAKKNNRPEGQAVLRRDLSAPARLRIAQAVAAEGVQSKTDLRQLAPATWRRLEVQFARSRIEWILQVPRPPGRPAGACQVRLYCRGCTFQDASCQKPYKNNGFLPADGQKYCRGCNFQEASSCFSKMAITFLTFTI